jgi:hypothetical protein
MSASRPPTPEEYSEVLGVTAEEASAIADAMSPLQSLTAAGADVGSVLESTPGAFPKLVGLVLQNMSTQAELASQSAELAARAITFYIEVQSDAPTSIAPPPGEVLELMRMQYQPLIDLVQGDGPF